MTRTWTEGQVSANGITVHYRRTGGERPPVVLLHGLTDSGACWTRLAHDLAADYDLVMPDARGHGRSSAPDAGYRPEDRAADTLGLIDVLGLDRPVLLGHSMGGLTAALVAADAPGHVQGAILEDPAFISPEAWASPMLKEWRAQHAAALAWSDEQMIASGRADHPGWPADVFPPWARAKLETSLRAFDWFDLPPHDFRATVARLGVPTLLVTGDVELGAVVPATVAKELAALSPRLRVAPVPGAGHCIRYEQPEQFAALVRAFLAERLG
jgi:pimeloyl-ACP methyl ester carboxylesterase